MENASFATEKLNEVTIDAALAVLDVIPSGRATLVDKAGLLREEFEGMEQEGRGHLLTGRCDVCGEVSSTAFDACPFCGTGESGVEVPESLPGPGEVQDPPEPGDGPEGDPDVPPPDYAEQESPDTAITAAEVLGPAPGVNPGSLDGDPPKTQKLTRKPRGKKGGTPEVTGTIEVPTPALDLYVAEVRRLHGMAGASLYVLATKLSDGEMSSVWKTRLGDDGKARYKTFRSFCEAELGFTGDYAYSLMRIRSRYTEQDFAQLGTTKLRLIAKVEDDQKHAEILQEAKQGATRAQIETKVREATGNRPSTKGEVRGGAAARNTLDNKPAASPEPARSAPVKLPEPQKQGVTVVLLEGKKKFPLFAAPKGKSDETPRRAKRVVDKPWGKIPLVVNDVEVLVTITVDSKGQLEGWAEARRVDPTK